MKRVWTAPMLAAALVGAAVPALASTKPVVKTVKVADDYYSPAKLTIRKGYEIKFAWSSANYDSHNVTLHSGPRGVKRTSFTSVTGTYGIRFVRRFTVPGTYHFYCTIHPSDMTLTVVVKR